MVCLGTVAKHLRVHALCHLPPASLDYEAAEFGLALPVLPQGHVSNLVASHRLLGAAQGSFGCLPHISPGADGVVGFEPGELAGLLV